MDKIQQDTKLKEVKEIEPPKKTAGQERLERLVDKDPAKVAQMLRNWLSEE